MTNVTILNFMASEKMSGITVAALYDDLIHSALRSQAACRIYRHYEHDFAENAWRACITDIRNDEYLFSLDCGYKVKSDTMFNFTSSYPYLKDNQAQGVITIQTSLLRTFLPEGGTLANTKEASSLAEELIHRYVQTLKEHGVIYTVA